MDTALNGILDILPSTADISNTIGDVVGTALNNTIGQALYIIVSGINWFFSVVFKFFEVFSGQIKVSYKGEYDYLTNIFFENSTISGIYWGMAIIGVVLCFAFTIIAVIRKMFDGSDKVQMSLGAILGSMFKSLLLILSLNLAMIVVMNFSNVLMQRVVFVFNAGSSLTEEKEITFTDDQYATMGRVLNTIGNYSLNPSHNSRYNLNSCYNEIRGDMLYLQDQGVFDFYYVTKDAQGNEIETWQSVLQDLVFVANLEKELKMDVYNEGVSNALLEIMDTLETNKNFYPLEYYKRADAPLNNIPLDRVLFLACTYNAAINEQYNVNPSHTDPLRGPYYNGEKSIYDFKQVSEDFNLIWGFNYIIFFLIVYGIFKEMRIILTDCVARIYNVILLYLVGPPFIALSPLDGGGKTKQWMTAFVVQCFGVFGTVIAMRLLLIFAPIIISSELQIFPNAVMDIIAKILLVDGGCMATRKASGMITGILADSAGFQSINAGSYRSDLNERRQRNEAEAARAKQDKAAKSADTAKSAAKVASGTGDLSDVKKVAQEVKDQQQQQQTGLQTPEQTNLGIGNKDEGPTPTTTDTSGPDPNIPTAPVSVTTGDTGNTGDTGSTINTVNTVEFQPIPPAPPLNLGNTDPNKPVTQKTPPKPRDKGTNDK